MTDGSHRCKKCRWDRLNASDKNCWRCGSRELEEVPIEIVLTEEDSMDKLRKLAYDVNQAWPYTTSLTRYECPSCKGVTYGPVNMGEHPCHCEKFWQAS